MINQNNIISTSKNTPPLPVQPVHSDKNDTSIRLSESAYSKILQMIIEGRLKAGERLVETKLAKTLGMSITPVRQALLQLEQQGMLNIYPYKGTYVATPTYEYAKDTYFMREKIERAAVELAFDKVSPEDADYLLDLCEQSERYFHEGDIYNCVVMDIILHSFFVDKSESPILSEMWNLIKNRIAFIQSHTKVIKISDRESVAQRHFYIIDAIRRGDKEFCIAAVAQHIRSAKYWMLKPENQNQKGE